MKVFGREPAAIVALLEAVLVLALSFGLFDLTQHTIGLIIAVVTAGFGVVLAVTTSETLLGPVVGFTKSALALAAVYGLSITTEQTGALIAVVGLVIGFWQRGQTSPVELASRPLVARH